MKKFLLPMLACGMYVGAFAQIGVSDKTIINPDKWIITPNKLKTTTGRLLLNNTTGSKWEIYVYRMADNRYITSVNQSNNKGILMLAPGEYKITLNLVPVDNVLIKKGHDTKLKTGVLDIPYNEVWYLYDETGEIYVTSGNSPGKLALPIGNYTLKIDGAGQQVMVGETLDQQVAPSGIEDSKYWVITPLEAMSADMGKLNIYIPKDTTVYVPAMNKTMTIPLFICDTVMSSTTGGTVNLPKYLAAGTYYFKLSRISGSPVPVKAGKETRLKAGFLVISEKKSEGEPGESDFEQVLDEMYGSNDFPDKVWTWKINLGGKVLTGKKGKIFALPPGEYTVVKTHPDDYSKKVIYKAVIKDGEWVVNGQKQ